MVWFQSDLKRDGHSRLVHQFYCPKCSEVAIIEKPWQGRLRLVPYSN
jgi:hypothetical protein